MCGIAGIFRFQGDPANDAAVVETMSERIAHRGPDGRGLDREGTVTFGHCRLAILDLSEAGRQPMRTPDGRFLVTFNGEIYNFAEIREELGEDPATLRSSSDTEILLLAWQRWGEAALDRFVGQFAFAIFDAREKTMWLARDRFGEKPLYLHRSSDAIAFASSLEALLATPWVPQEFDPSSLAEFLTLRYVVAPRTLLAGVDKLPPGHLIRVTPDGVTVRAWYTPHFRVSSEWRSEAERVEEFDARFLQATKRCLVSDVPVALLLSSGIDSVSIAKAIERLDRPVTSYTFRPRATADAAGATRDADGAGLDVAVTAADRVREMVPAFGSLTEPVGDGAALATWFLIRGARPQATVFLCGHGGDEVLGGYRLSQDRFRLSALWRLSWLPEAWIRPVVDRYLFGDEPVRDRLARLRAANHREVPAAARYLMHRPLPGIDVAHLLGATPTPSGLDVVDRLYGLCESNAGQLDRIQEVMLPTFLSENILSFADSVSMDSSAELRMPFLDRDVVDLVLASPERARVSRWPGRANTKLLLREWGRRHLSEQTVTRRKRTFNFGNLPALLHEHGDTLRGYVLDAPAVRRAMPGVDAWVRQAPETFHGPWEGTLWALMALGIWSNRVGLR